MPVHVLHAIIGVIFASIWLFSMRIAVARPRRTS